MDKEKINDYASKLSEALEDKIKVITSIKYHYDLEELASSINKLSENDAEVVLEQLINERLEEIKNSPNKDKYRENIKSIDEITDFFIYNNDKSSSVEEGSFVVSDLINKVIGIIVLSYGRSFKEGVIFIGSSLAVTVTWSNKLRGFFYSEHVLVKKGEHGTVS